MECPDPKRNITRVDTELPSERQSNTDLCEPALAKERKLSVLVIATFSRSDMDEANRAIPNSDTRDPQLLRLRKETADPKCVKSKTLTDPRRLAIERIEKLEASVAKAKIENSRPL